MHKTTEPQNRWSKNWQELKENRHLQLYWSLRHPPFQKLKLPDWWSAKIQNSTPPSTNNDLTDIYRTLHSTMNKTHIFFLKCPWKIHWDHILGHKTKLNKFKRNEILKEYIFWSQISNSGAISRHMERKQYTSNNLWVKEEVAKKNLKYKELKLKIQQIKISGIQPVVWRGKLIELKIIHD